MGVWAYGWKEGWMEGDVNWLQLWSCDWLTGWLAGWMDDYGMGWDEVSALLLLRCLRSESERHE